MYKNLNLNDFTKTGSDLNLLNISVLKEIVGDKYKLDENVRIRNYQILICNILNAVPNNNPCYDILITKIGNIEEYKEYAYLELIRNINTKKEYYKNIDFNKLSTVELEVLLMDKQLYNYITTEQENILSDIILSYNKTDVFKFIKIIFSKDYVLNPNFSLFYNNKDNSKLLYAIECLKKELSY